MKKQNAKNRISIIPLVLAVVLVLTPPVIISADTDATVQSYEEQLANIAYHIEAAQNNLSRIRSEKANTWEEAYELDQLIGYNETWKQLAEKQLDTLNKQIEETESRIKNLEVKIENQHNAYLERMAREYMEQETDYVELILGSSNLVDFLSKLEYVSSIIDYDNRIISELDANKAELEAEKAKLAKAKDDQALKVKDYEDAIKSSQDAYDQKIALMASLEVDENASINTYTYYKELEDQLNRELAAYLAELQRKSQSAYVGGTGGWPLQAGVNVYVSSEFGWRVLWGVNDYHYGIDLACANGTEIYAFNGGTVVKSEWHYSYGNYVVIDHGGGISTLYAHMSQRVAQAGDYVAPGQLIGYVGMTGSASGYHLHFEVRENGEVVQPRNYLTFP